MNRALHLSLPLLLAGALAMPFAAGCGKNSDEEPAPGPVDAGGEVPDAGGGAPDAGGGADAAVPDAGFAAAPLLDSAHPGWTQTSCSGCHSEASLPKPPHVTGMTAPDCADCHGANGACDPNGGSKTNHAATNNCTGCHGSQHGYAANADCASCHFASKGGTRDCTP